MTNQNPENPPVSPGIQQPNDTRRRLRELLSIPERDRTDEQWDEIIELEIQLAPGNRISGNEHGGGMSGGGHHHNKSAGGGGGQQKKHRPRTNNNNRRPRQNKPNPAGGAGGGGGGGTPAA